jgi:PEGA domain-containing protein
MALFRAVFAGTRSAELGVGSQIRSISMRLADVVRSVFVCLALACSVIPARAQVAQNDLGTLAIRARPANAEVRVDGERWVTPENNDALLIQLPPGRHTIDIRAPGYRPYTTIVDIRRGETTPLNVSLGSAEPAAGPVAAAAASSSPLVEVPSAEDGFAIAPDFRISEVNHQTTQFAGFYGGAVFAGQLLVGAGAYWQVNSSTDMWYTGPIVEWRIFGDRAIGLTAHGLIGYGEANLFQPIAFGGRGQNRHDVHSFHGVEGFFVAEPEAQFIARLSSFMRLHVGAGYRFTSSHGDFDGASGSVSLQFGR